MFPFYFIPGSQFETVVEKVLVKTKILAIRFQRVGRKASFYRQIAQEIC